MESKNKLNLYQINKSIFYTLSSLSTAELIGRKDASGTPHTAKTASSNFL